MNSDLIPTPAHFFGADDARREANISRAEARGLESCAICGRGVNSGKGWEVIVTDGGEHLLSFTTFTADPDLHQNDPGFMGAWVVGPECGKGIPATHRVRNP